jgi:hypothetical protein
MLVDKGVQFRMKEELEEQKKALQKLVGSVAPAETRSFGGVVVSSAREWSLASARDVKELLEHWNLPMLLRRGAGKADTKSETLRAYAAGLDARLKRQGQALGACPSAAAAAAEEDWAVNARRFLRLVVEYRSLDKLPASLGAYASLCHRVCALDGPGGGPGGGGRERLLPEVVHAKAPASSAESAAGVGAGDHGDAGSGLASTGRISVKPLQHLQKAVCLANDTPPCPHDSPGQPFHRTHSYGLSFLQLTPKLVL